MVIFLFSREIKIITKDNTVQKKCICDLSLLQNLFKCCKETKAQHILQPTSYLAVTTQDNNFPKFVSKFSYLFPLKMHKSKLADKRENTKLGLVNAYTPSVPLLFGVISNDICIPFKGRVWSLLNICIMYAYIVYCII